MIKDSQAKTHLNQSWAAIRKLCGSGHVFWTRGAAISVRTPDSTFNLPFVLAYAVLDQCLNVLISEGTIVCKDWKLGVKMAASKDILPWVDYPLVDDGRSVRNAVAHEAILATKEDCLKFVNAIEAEFKAWGVLPR
jgi:hypothetical protein